MQQFYVWKLFDRVLAPFEQSYVELAAFLGLCILATAALLVQRRRQVWRFAIQLASLAVFFLIVSSCLGVFGLIRNAFLGLRLLSEQDDLSAFYWMSMTMVAVGAAFVGGAVFCGWICPTGTLQEWAGWLAARFEGRGKKLEVRGQRQEGKRGRAGALAFWAAIVTVFLAVSYRVFSGRRPILEDSAALWAGALSVLVAMVLIAPRTSGALRRFRAVSLALILGFTLAGISVFSPVHFIFMNVQDWASMLSGAMIVGAGFFVARAWCRYLCPFGLVCGWAARHAAFQIERKPSCTHCGVCDGVCEMEAIHHGHIAISSCIACMKCVDHCPEKALELVARPFRQEREGLARAKRPSAPLVRIGLILGLGLLYGTEAHAATVLWNGFRGDAEATAFREFNQMPNVEVPTSWTFRGSDVTWNYAPGASVWSAPAIAPVGGRVVCFAGSYDHNVYAIDAATGKELWRYPTGSGVFSTPAVARIGERDCVLAASSDRTLYCLDAARGIKLWAYEVYEWRQSLGRAFVGSPIVWDDSGRTVIILVSWIYDTAPQQVTEKAEILALTPENGTARLLWRRQFAESHPTHPVMGTINGQPRIYVGCRDGNLYCLDSRGGSELWRKTSKFPIDGAPAFLGNGAKEQPPAASARPMVFVGSKFGDVRGFDAETGDLRWSCKVGHWVDATPAVIRMPDGSEWVVFGSYDGRVYCREARTGRARWHYTTRGNVSASAAIVPRPNGFEVYVPSDDDMLHAIDGMTGRGLWQISPGPFLWTYRGLGDTIWESPAVVRLGGADLLIQPFYDGRIHAYRLDRADRWVGRTGNPAYGRAMVVRIAASMIGTLALALVFVRMGKKA